MSAAQQDDAVRMLRDSAAAVVPPGRDLKRIRALRFQSPPFDRTMWRTMCEMGWPGLRVPEAAGGAGLGMLAATASPPWTWSTTMHDGTALNEMHDTTFCATVSAWVQATYPGDLRHPPKRLHWRDNKPWYMALSEKGWLAPGCPCE